MEIINFKVATFSKNYNNLDRLFNNWLINNPTFDIIDIHHSVCFESDALAFRQFALISYFEAKTSEGE